jgi:hypothetical protein
MDLDDDEPPVLVAQDGTDAVPGSLDSKIEDMNLVKVPITILTGKLCSFS